MADPVFRSAGAWNFTANSVPTGPTLTPGAPAGVAVGDGLILISETRNITATATTPSGWNLVSGFPMRSAVSNGGTIYVWTRIADGTGADTPSVVWSGLSGGTSGDATGAGILCYQNMSETLDGTAVKFDTSGSSTVTIATYTTGTDKSLVIGIATKFSESAGQTATITNFTERAENSTTSGIGHLIEVADLVQSPAGATGTAVVTWSNTGAARELCATIAFLSTGGVTRAISGTIAATATVSGAVQLSGIRPAGIGATATVAGSISGRRAILPAAVSATATVTGIAGVIKHLHPSIVSTSLVTGTLKRVKFLFAGAISATSTVGATGIFGPPILSVAPVISGTPQVGQLLTATQGTWA